MSARERINSLLDPEGRFEIGQEVLAVDALKFKDSRKYSERLQEAIDQTGETDAIVVMGGAICAGSHRSTYGFCIGCRLGRRQDARGFDLADANGKNHGHAQ
jgi:hypothetical protein